MFSCRYPRGFASLREAQLQKMYLVYAGEGIAPDLNQNLINLRREHCLRSRGGGFFCYEK